MVIIIGHQETCAIIERGPTQSTNVPGVWNTGPLPQITVPTQCTCGGVQMTLQLNARGDLVWLPRQAEIERSSCSRPCCGGECNGCECANCGCMFVLEVTVMGDLPRAAVRYLDQVITLVDKERRPVQRFRCVQVEIGGDDRVIYQWQPEEAMLVG